MDKYIWLIAVVAVCIGLSALIKRFDGSFGSSNSKKILYKYNLRKHIMTSREEDFFRTLTDIFQDRWYIVPQIGLSTLLNHEVKGQNWQGAFQHINRKTVDYVLLSKSDLSAVCAIELDDSTHDYQSRKNRDSEVERIFKSVNLPLVRFRNISNLTKQDIVNRIATAIKDTK